MNEKYVYLCIKKFSIQFDHYFRGRKNIFDNKKKSSTHGNIVITRDKIIEVIKAWQTTCIPTKFVKLIRLVDG